MEPNKITQRVNGTHSNPIKVGLFLSGEPSGGGKFQYCLSMLESLVERGQGQVDLVGAAESPLWTKIFTDHGIPSVLVQTAGWTDRWRRFAKRVGLPLSIRRKLSRYFDPQGRKMSATRRDLWIFPSHDEAAIELPFKSLVSVHDLMHRYEKKFPEVSGDGQYETREIFFHGVAKTAAAVLVDSRVGKAQFEESYSFDSNRVYALPYVPHTHNAQGAGADTLELPTKYIFYPAQFWMHKNHRRLIESIALIRDRSGILVDLVLVGSKKNGYEECLHLVEYLHLSDQVHFMGYVEEEKIPELYRRARAMVMPTCLGPTNIPQLEAFVYRCPVATSRIYGIPEQVGNAALLFDPYSVEEIADTIQKLWVDDTACAELVRNGIQRTIEWNKQKFGDRLIEIIKAVEKSPN